MCLQALASAINNRKTTSLPSLSDNIEALISKHRIDGSGVSKADVDFCNNKFEDIAGKVAEAVAFLKDGGYFRPAADVLGGSTAVC